MFVVRTWQNVNIFYHQPTSGYAKKYQIADLSSKSLPWRSVHLYHLKPISWTFFTGDKNSTVENSGSIQCYFLPTGIFSAPDLAWKKWHEAYFVAKLTAASCCTTDLVFYSSSAGQLAVFIPWHLPDGVSILLRGPGWTPVLYFALFKKIKIKN